MSGLTSWGSTHDSENPTINLPFQAALDRIRMSVADVACRNVISRKRWWCTIGAQVVHMQAST